MIQARDRGTLRFDCTLVLWALKAVRVSLIEILNNPGGKVDTCGTSLVRVSRLTGHSDNRPMGVVCLLEFSVEREWKCHREQSGDLQKSIRLHLLFPLHLPGLSHGRRGWCSSLQKPILVVAW